jgi:hypothetical protein
MKEDYTQKERDILSYISKINLARISKNWHEVTLLLNLQYSKVKVDETWFEMTKNDLVSFLEKRGNKDFSKVDKDLINLGIHSDEAFYVNFY